MAQGEPPVPQAPGGSPISQLVPRQQPLQFAAPQVGQGPQFAVRGRPQLSVPENDPQLTPLFAQNCASVSGVQPQALGTPPPPQVCGEVQVPQLTVRELAQLSRPDTCPQLAL